MKELRKQIRQQILAEAQLDLHYQERLYDRFLNKDILTVGFELPNTRGEYMPVGTYVLPEAIKAQIVANAQLVENYNFPRAKSFGVQIASVNIDRNQVNYIGESEKQASIGKPLVFIDEKTGSNGNVVFLIVRENQVKTIYFAKSYVVQDATKLRVDVIVKSMDALRDKKIR